MSQKKNKYIPKANSLKNAFCVFEERVFEEVEGLKEDYKSKSGSIYFYTKEGMYRYSNHWGRLANSKWRLINKDLTDSKYKLGFANWNQFYPDNDYEKLYYLDWNKSKNEILYQHKNDPAYSGLEILRTSIETIKRLKNARNILTLTNWAKHFDEDIDVLREKIINDLIYTDLSLEEIKRKYL
ncbi:MAG: hypothetical protein QM535_11455 [Limnohabitans sp.]|nr:hypothetical protein [Limnohabitans sp.]